MKRVLFVGLLLLGCEPAPVVTTYTPVEIERAEPQKQCLLDALAAVPESAMRAAIGPVFSACFPPPTPPKAAPKAETPAEAPK